MRIDVHYLADNGNLQHASQFRDGQQVFMASGGGRFVIVQVKYNYSRSGACYPTFDIYWTNDAGGNYVKETSKSHYHKAVGKAVSLLLKK